MIGIYKITSPKGRVYIGQSTDVEKRIKYYRYLHCKKQIRLYNSFIKYGVDNHIFEIIEECDESKLNDRERFYQEKFNVISNNGLNCELTSSSNHPRVLSNESKKKIGIKNSGSNNGMYGVIHTEEFKANRRAHKHTDEVKKLISIRSAGANNPQAKLVLDTQTGIIYGCVGDAAEVLGIKRDTLKQWLNGRRVNKSNYIYA